MWLKAVFHSHLVRETLIPTNVDALALEVPGACMTQLQAIFGLRVYLDCNKTNPFYAGSLMFREDSFQWLKHAYIM